MRLSAPALKERRAGHPDLPRPRASRLPRFDYRDPRPGERERDVPHLPSFGGWRSGYTMTIDITCGQGGFGTPGSPSRAAGHLSFSVLRRTRGRSPRPPPALLGALPCSGRRPAFARLQRAGDRKHAWRPPEGRRGSARGAPGRARSADLACGKASSGGSGRSVVAATLVRRTAHRILST